MDMLRCLKINSVLLLGILLLPLLAVDCSDSNLEAKDALEHKSPLVANHNGSNDANQQNVGAKYGSDSKFGGPLKKKEQLENPKEVIPNDPLKSNISKQLESKDKVEKFSEDNSNVGFTNRDKDSSNIGGSKEGLDPKQVIKKDKGSDNAGGLNEGDKSKQMIDKETSGNKGGSNRSNNSKQVVDNEESDDKGTSEDRENSKQVTIKDKESGNTGASDEGIDSNQLSSKDDHKESSGSWMDVKENFRDEECDPSNMCIDEKKNLTACLRVPGDDSPNLSLQIRNKGTRPATISITAPAFVQLEETKVQLQPKEYKKVKVTIAYEGMDSQIFLTTEDSRCTLDFKELVAHEATVETRYAFKLRYLNKTHFIIFLTLTAFLVFGCAWMYFGLHKKLILRNGYQAVEMELPVSVVQKTVSETNGGWDNSWDDNWDDEEAPITPTLPATPNLSSRGLASRRLTKEAWKD